MSDKQDLYFTYSTINRIFRLSMGCGWGPLVNYITNEVGAKCIGLTLSDAQAEACRKNGLEVYIKNCLEVTPDDYGTFAVVSL